MREEEVVAKSNNIQVTIL